MDEATAAFEQIDPELWPVKLCVDTSAYSQFKRGEATVVEILDRAERVFVPAVVLGELRTGLALGSRVRDNRAGARRVPAQSRRRNVERRCARRECTPRSSWRSGERERRCPPTTLDRGERCQRRRHGAHLRRATFGRSPAWAASCCGSGLSSGGEPRPFKSRPPISVRAGALPTSRRGRRLAGRNCGSSRPSVPARPACRAGADAGGRPSLRREVFGRRGGEWARPAMSR